MYKGFKNLEKVQDIVNQSWDREVSGMQGVIDFAHLEAHEGSRYSLCVNKTASTSLIVAFHVGAGTKQPHLIFNWKSEETGLINFYKGATWTAGSGSDITPINSNDNSTNTSILEGNSTSSFVANKVTQDPTGLSTAGATLIYCEPAWSTNQSAASGQAGRRNEHILEPDETYVVQITAASGGIWLNLDWYEHTPINID